MPGASDCPVCGAMLNKFGEVLPNVTTTVEPITLADVARVLTIGSGAVVVAWTVAFVGHPLLVALVPGCTVGAKGFPINCGWASGIIDSLSVVGFWLGVLLLAALPCLVLGAVLWCIALAKRRHGEDRA